MKIRPGANLKKADAGECMVVECHKRALYRCGRSQRGYCKEHRGLATPNGDHKAGRLERHMASHNNTADTWTASMLDIVGKREQ